MVAPSDAYPWFDPMLVSTVPILTCATLAFRGAPEPLQIATVERDSLPAGDLFSPKQTPVLYRGVKAGNDIWNAPEARGARPEREDLTCPLSFTRSLAVAKEFADWRKPGRVHAVHFARDKRGRGRAVRGVDVAAMVREDAGLLPQERAGAEREAEVMLWGLRLTRTSGGPRVTHWRADALDDVTAESRRL
eukprot:jgi/Tetstr1/454269/TSEL_041188.t1